MSAYIAQSVTKRMVTAEFILIEMENPVNNKYAHDAQQQIGDGVISPEYNYNNVSNKNQRREIAVINELTKCFKISFTNNTQQKIQYIFQDKHCTQHFKNRMLKRIGYKPER